MLSANLISPGQICAAHGQRQPCHGEHIFRTFGNDMNALPRAGINFRSLNNNFEKACERNNKALKNASDVHYLFDALRDFCIDKSQAGFNAYSSRALSRIWKAERFSWWMTNLLHNFPGSGAFDYKVRQAELEYLVTSDAAATSPAENYVGLPY